MVIIVERRERQSKRPQQQPQKDDVFEFDPARECAPATVTRSRSRPAPAPATGTAAKTATTAPAPPTAAATATTVPAPPAAAPAIATAATTATTAPAPPIQPGNAGSNETAATAPAAPAAAPATAAPAKATAATAPFATGDPAPVTTTINVFARRAPLADPTKKGQLNRQQHGPKTGKPAEEGDDPAWECDSSHVSGNSAGLAVAVEGLPLGYSEHTAESESKGCLDQDLSLIHI